LADQLIGPSLKPGNGIAALSEGAGLADQLIGPSLKPVHHDPLGVPSPVVWPIN